MEHEVKTLTREKVKPIEIYEKNCEAMEEYFPKGETQDISELKEENRELKMKLNQLSTEMKVHDKHSQ